MPIDKLAKLRVTRTAATGKGDLEIPIKRTFSHRAGTKFSRRQQQANARSSGMTQVFYVNQVIDSIEAKLLDTNNENLMNRLQVLHELLSELLEETAVK